MAKDTYKRRLKSGKVIVVKKPKRGVAKAKQVQKKNKIKRGAGATAIVGAAALGARAYSRKKRGRGK